MTQELTTLVTRLERLERQNRRLKLAGLGLAGLFGAIGLVGMAGPRCDVVSAERFVLHDARGSQRMVIDAYQTEPTITLKNAQGATVAQLGVGKDGDAYLTHFDAKGKLRGNVFAAGQATGAENTESKGQCDKAKSDSSIAMR